MKDININGHNFIHSPARHTNDGEIFVCENCDSNVFVRGQIYWFWIKAELVNAALMKQLSKFNNELSCNECVIRNIID